MTDPRDADVVPLNPPDVEPEDKRAQLEGTPPRMDQDAVLDTGELDTSGGVTDTEVYEGELEALGAEADAASLESLAATGDRDGETDDPDVAAEEGVTWIPPADPPVVADRDAPGGVRVAAGFGETALDEPFDADHHASALPEDDEVSARVREALLADSRTSRLADRVGIETEAGVVTIRGTVDDVEDGDLLEEVASIVSGVTEVRDGTDVDGL